MSRPVSVFAAAGLVALAAANAHAQTPAPAGVSANVDTIVVTARRLDDARAAIQPQIGASVYTVDARAIEAMPGGSNVQLNQVVLRTPGATQDSYGQLHIRGDHNGLQFRLNGTILPEGLSVFGQSLSPRLADKVEIITGALPAQYGLRTAGIVDITTKTGFQNSGSMSIYGGSHGVYQPSFEVSRSSGADSLFVSGSFLRSQLGIESPDGRSTPAHDRTDQAQGFVYFDHIIDPTSRVSIIGGLSNQRFQLPDPAGLQPDLGLTVRGRTAFPSEALDDTQRETTAYAIASYLKTTERFTGQLSLFARRSTLTYRPNPAVGDLLYDGVSQYAAKQDNAAGLQAEGVYHAGTAHTLRGGVILQVDRATGDTRSTVLPVDAGGAQTSDIPFTIAEASRNVAHTYSVYLQDEWKLASSLIFNYGLRFDEADAFRDERQLSPRANLVWTPLPATTVHAGYARYFSPAPFELIANASAARFAGTTAAFPGGSTGDTPLAERDNYYDLGVSQTLARGFTVGVDAYYRDANRLLDEGQFGAPIVLTPFNYRDGRVKGVEFTTAYARGPLNVYASLAVSKAIGRDIISSQFSFDPGDLDYIADHFIYLDHDQTYTASAGASYRLAGTLLSTDLLLGSGLRADGAVSNGRSLPGYVQVNLAVSHRFESLPTGPYEVRLDVINLFDRRYQIRDGSGIGVGAPQFGPRRGVFAGVTKSF